MVNMATTDARRIQLAMLWRSDRGEFLAEYRRIVGDAPGSSAAMSLTSMIDRILEHEAAAGSLGK
jgi:hypothetical protein